MDDVIKNNPLYTAQREKAGAETFDKYDYQYHWALYKVISEHRELKEYAVFIEFHEDVVIASSLDSTKATFDFNQVKTTGKKYNTYQLVINRKKIKDGLEPSILSKLILTVHEKDFKDRISYINLVATNGFSLECKDKDVLLNKITLNDLSENQYTELENAIIEEIEITSLPINIQFIVPDLPEKKYEDVVIASIAKLIGTIYPYSQTDCVEIYRILIDELRRKGKVKYDYKRWNDLLKHKALTSNTVSETISAFTSLKDETKIELEFNDICKEIGIELSIQKRELRNAFNRYKQVRISNKSTNQIDIKVHILELINKYINDVDFDFNELLKRIINEIPQNIKQQFHSEIDLKGAIICEYIMMV